MPYGNKSPETVRRYSREILDFLLSRDVKLVVVACTRPALTPSRSAAPRPGPGRGRDEPGARAAVAASRSGRIGVIGTAGTVASGAYKRAIEAADSGVRVTAQACPLFVPLVEEGWLTTPPPGDRRGVPGAAAREDIDTLVLGCTHYPLLKPLLSRCSVPPSR